MRFRFFQAPFRLIYLVPALAFLCTGFWGCTAPGDKDPLLDADPSEALMDGDYSRAVQILTAQAAKAPNDPELQYLLGLSYFRLGLAFVEDPSAGGNPGNAFLDAEGFFSRALQLDPDHRNAGLMLAEARYMNNNLEPAYQAANRCLERYPEDGEVLEMAGRIGLALARQVDPSEGREYLDEAISRLGKAIAVDSRLQGAYLYLGDAYLQNRDFLTATEVYKKGIEACPLSNPLHERLLYLFDAGTDLTVSDAIAFYESLAARLGGASDEEKGKVWWFKGTWHGYKGRAHYAREEYDLAGKAFSAHIHCLEKSKEAFAPYVSETDLLTGTVRVNRGWCRLKLERLEETETDFFAALSQDPENENTLFAIDSLGFAVFRIKGLDAARDFFERLTAHYGERHQWWNDFGYFSLESNMRSPEPDFEATLAIYRRALELEPDYPRYLNDAAMIMDYYLYPEGEKSAEVEALYMKAWKLGKNRYESPFTDEVEKTTMFSSYTDALVNLARLYLKQARFEACRGILDELLAVAPDREEAVKLEEAYEKAVEKKTPGGS